MGIWNGCQEIGFSVNTDKFDINLLSIFLFLHPFCLYIFSMHIFAQSKAKELSLAKQDYNFTQTRSII